VCLGFQRLPSSVEGLRSAATAGDDVRQPAGAACVRARGRGGRRVGRSASTECGASDREFDNCVGRGRVTSAGQRANSCDGMSKAVGRLQALSPQFLSAAWHTGGRQGGRAGRRVGGREGGGGRGVTVHGRHRCYSSTSSLGTGAGRLARRRRMPRTPTHARAKPTDCLRR
jgi:hypothetical protein